MDSDTRAHGNTSALPRLPRPTKPRAQDTKEIPTSPGDPHTVFPTCERHAAAGGLSRCWDGGHPGAVQARTGGPPCGFAAPGKKGLVFCGRGAQPLRPASWYTAWGWAMKALDIEGMKPHDLRHSGNTLAAMTGDSTKELMARLGQSTSRAALIYQHATQDRDHEIADALNGMIEAKLKQRPTGTEGPTPIA
jgi:hypothetical protein